MNANSTPSRSPSPDASAGTGVRGGENVCAELCTITPPRFEGEQEGVLDFVVTRPGQPGRAVLLWWAAPFQEGLPAMSSAFMLARGTPE